jgi:redox-sensitive bicupin YhaK (pirin superfamily)
MTTSSSTPSTTASGLSFRLAAERFHSQLDWLDSWHSFSFSSHYDPAWMGHAEVLRAGEVQCMSAGTGVVHSEINQGDKPCRLLQIWIEPSSTGIAPAYEQKPFAIGRGWTPLLDPEQAHGAMAIHRPVRLWRAQPGAGETLSLVLGKGRKGWIQLIDGAGDANGHPLQQGDGLGYGAGKLEAFTAGAAGADLLLFELC